GEEIDQFGEVLHIRNSTGFVEFPNRSSGASSRPPVSAQRGRTLFGTDRSCFEIGARSTARVLQQPRRTKKPSLALGGDGFRPSHGRNVLVAARLCRAGEWVL